MSKSTDLYVKSKKIIPGGTQLLSKRPELFLPDNWPSYYSKAKGCEVWDLDDKKYIDMSFMGVGSCTVGYSDDDIDKAVTGSISMGNMSTLNVPEEVELAELLCELHPWADMVRYSRTGGESCAMAVRIARAYSKRDIVLFSGYHGWSDWYLASNIADESNLDKVHLQGLEPNGVPKSLSGSAYPFYHNDTESFTRLIEKYGDRVGAVIIEPIRDKIPEKIFLETIRELTTKYDIPFIIDEVSSGFRLTVGGAHLLYGVEPDIAVFAKGMSNGFPMAAVIGRKEIMDAAQTSFISSTYWSDKTGPVAALATIRKMMEHNIPEQLAENGKRMMAIWKEMSEKHQLKTHVGGMDPIVHFAFEHEDGLALKTLFTQEMLKEGFLASTGYYASFAHKDEHFQKYAAATDKVFGMIAGAISCNEHLQLLEGPVCHSGFERLT